MPEWLAALRRALGHDPANDREQREIERFQVKAEAHERKVDRWVERQEREDRIVTDYQAANHTVKRRAR